LLKALVDRVRNGCSPITLNLPHDFDAFLLTAYRLAAEQAQISEAGGLAHFQDLLEAGRTDGWEPLFSPLLSPAGEDRPLFVFDNLEVLSLHTF
jgi:hypothetical protein